MKRIIFAFVVSIAFLLSLSAVDSATGIGANVFFQGQGIFQSTFSECTNLASQFGGQYASERCGMCAQLNVYRQRHGRPPLRIHPFLMRTAQWWSEVQAFHGEGGHPEAVNQRYLKYYKSAVRRSGLFCKSNQNSGTTPTTLGIRSASTGEISAWAQSSGHNQNQLGRWAFMGCGLATGKCEPSLSKYRSCYYSTMDFGG